jgi:UDP-GlcNAc:undecaprenyl-phosphate/decaprenyl-phosphate GlcNAc-1-phosphate transferase
VTFWWARVIEVGFAVVGALLIPWLAMRALVPTLERSAVTVENYRGRRVALGLGLVWAVWAVGVLLAQVLVEQASLLWWANWQDPPSGSALDYFAPLTLVLGTALVGMADDVFGSGSEKGFRGHLSALRHGRLTMGAFKLLAIGMFAVLATAPTLLVSFVGHEPTGAFVRWVLSALAIALTANLVNLLDLRPGRALKGYTAIAVLGAAALLVPGMRWDTVVIVLVLLLGPVVAIWPYDLGERAMLGDAGANAAGALGGWLAVIVLGDTWWALALYVAFVLALNLASERVSFSRVIDGNPLLRWLDGIGRLPADESDIGLSEKSSREVAAAEK